MNVKKLQERLVAAVYENDDPVLLDMVLKIFQNSSTVVQAKSDKKKAGRVGKVGYSDVLRQGQGCLPAGK